MKNKTLKKNNRSLEKKEKKKEIIIIKRRLKSGKNEWKCDDETISNRLFLLLFIKRYYAKQLFNQ